MKKEVPTATPRLKSMYRITTRRLVAAQTMHRIRHGSINGYPCRHAYLSLSGSRSPKFAEIPKKSSRREVFRNPVRLVSREQLYRLEHLRPFRWNSGQVRLCCREIKQFRGEDCRNSREIEICRGSIDLFYSWSISLIAFFRTVSSISLPFVSSIHAV